MQIPNKKFYYFDTLYLDSANVRKIFDICKYYFKNIFYYKFGSLLKFLYICQK